MDFIFSIPTPPAAIIFSPFQTPIGFIFAIPNVTIGGGLGGTVNVYLDGVLNQSIASSDLDAEDIEISL